MILFGAVIAGILGFLFWLERMLSRQENKMMGWILPGLLMIFLLVTGIGSIPEGDYFPVYFFGIPMMILWAIYYFTRHRKG